MIIKSQYSTTQSAFCWGINTAKQSEFLNLKFGVHIAYNIDNYFGYTLAPANYDPDNFNPTSLNVGQWLDAFVAAGMGYAMLSIKTHIGFCLWPSNYHVTGYEPYSVEQSSWWVNAETSDVTKMFVDGCVSRGLKPVVYFSIWDYTWEARFGKNEKTDPDSYKIMIKAQLQELITNYLGIYGIWFDGWGWKISYDDISFGSIYNYIKSLNPNILIFSNDQLKTLSPSDIKLYEVPTAGNVAVGNTLCSEEVDPIRKDDNWREIDGFDKSVSAYWSASEIKAKIDLAQSKNSNYITGVGIELDGLLTQVQVDVLAGVGELF